MQEKLRFRWPQVAHDYFGENCFGAVVTRHGYADVSHIGNIEILYASHPVPDESSMEAANRIIDIADSVNQDTQVLFLISGGGSALLTKPIDGLDFAQKIAINKFLLASGADIEEINVVRKQLSGIKGGKLAARIKRKHSSLIISDVVGDKLEVIASGPTIVDDSTPEQAISILEKYGYEQLPVLSQYWNVRMHHNLDLTLPMRRLLQMRNSLLIKRFNLPGNKDTIVRS